MCILKRNLIDLIIKGGLNNPQPEKPNGEVSQTEPQMRPQHEEIVKRCGIFT